MANFTRYSPDSQLSFSIHGYWLLETGTKGKYLELVPDGHPELVFVRRGALWYRIKNEDTWQQFDSSGVLGQLGGQFQVHIPANSEILFVKFHPWAAHSLLELPLYLLNNTIVELGGLELSTQWSALSHRIRSCENHRWCVRILDAFFLNAFQHVPPSPPLLQFSVQNIFRTKGTIALDALSGQLRVSNRYLQQIFKQQLGLSPKHYARIIRVKRASIQMLTPDFRYPLVQIAAELDYFDQSHFLKDFKSIVGKSPSRFLQEESGVNPEALASYLGQWAYS